MDRSKIFNIILFITCLICSPCLSDSQELSETQKHLDSCQKNIEKNEYAVAIEECQKALQTDPQNPEVYNSLGFAYFIGKNFNYAIKNYNQAIAINPKMAVFYHNRALVYSEQKDTSRALADHSKALELSPNTADYYLARGLEYHYQNLLDQAIADYDKAIQYDPKLQYAYKTRAQAYYANGKYDQVVINITKLLEFQPNDPDPEALFIRGSAYIGQAVKLTVDQQLVANAISDCTRTTVLDSKYAPAYYCLATAYFLKSQFSESISNANKALDLNFTQGVYYIRAKAYYSLQKYDKALEDVKKAQTLGEYIDPEFLNNLNAAINSPK